MCLKSFLSFARTSLSAPISKSLIRFLEAKTSCASSVMRPAMITSKKISFIFSANSFVTTPFTATTPPNAETGSHLSASTYASTRLSRIAKPHGFPCFVIHTAFSSPNAEAIFTAPLRSFKLLKLASPLSVLKLFE